MDDNSQIVFSILGLVLVVVCQYSTFTSGSTIRGLLQAP